MKAILGRKLGMTQVFDEEGRAVPVTVIKAGPCVVVRRKRKDPDGYDAIQVGFEAVKESKLTKPVRGQFAKAKVGPFRVLREFRVGEGEEYSVGQEIKADVFSAGELVDVTATSKGKGFAGGIKRHGFQRGPMAHGSKYHRRPGSLGAKGPARTFKGRKLPGHLGAARVTVQNLKVVSADAERNLLLVQGSVPGPAKGLVVVKSPAKAR
ncbi:MAG: 50S ribosomal protein L3 [Clostridia bacterium]|nr:50S ribosomal protein L3 [Clostridia bacterium]